MATRTRVRVANRPPEVPQRDNYVMLEEYSFLRSQGVSDAAMHTRLGMSREAFVKAMGRAKREGDSRAVGFTYT